MRLKVLLSLIIILIFTISSFGQTSDIDSLIQLARLSPDNKKKCDLLNNIALSYLQIDVNKAIRYADKAFQLSLRLDYEKGQAQSYLIEGIAYQSLNNYKLATDKLFSSLILQKKANDKKLIISTFHRLGSVCKTTGNYDQALDYCLNALKLANEQNDTSALISIYNTMGSIYKYMGDYEQSFKYYYKCRDMLKRSNREDFLSGIYNNIGIVHWRMNEFDKALKYYRKSLAISTKIKDSANISGTFSNIAEVLLKQKKLDSAFFYLNRSLNIKQQTNDKRSTINIYLDFADYYCQTKDYSKSVAYTNKALKMAKEYQIPIYIKRGYKLFKNIYEAKGDYQKALNYQIKYTQINDSIFNMEKYIRIAQLDDLYRNEYEQAKQDVEEQKKRLIILGVLGILLFSIVVLFFIYYNLRLKFKRNKLNKIKLEVEKEKLISELNNNNRDLTRNIIYLTEKNELILDLKKKLENLKSNLKVENKALVQSVINEMNASTNTKIWEEFEVRFNSVHKNFYDKFYKKHPDLTQNEKRLVAFLKLNMSTKEISMITKQSVHSIGVARTRLRKKLGLSNTDINIYSYLDQF